MQEACLTLALLFKNGYRNEKIKEYAIAAAKFWSEIQNKDGSFNEYMPNEHSHVATAFSTYCIANTYKILGIDDEQILNSLIKAGSWLGKNDDLVVVNHDAGAVASLYLIYEITKNDKFLKYCKNKLRKVIENQNQEGWFSEYGGADIGYQSFSIYYLAKYYDMSGDKSIIKPLESAIKFFSYFIHPDRSIGGFYGSRETSFIIPTGFEVFPNGLSKSISYEIKKGLASKKIIGPYSFDDRFLANSLYPYLEAHEYENKKIKKIPLPKDQKNFEKYFKNAGLFVKKTDNFYIIINVKKGGIMKVFSNKKLIHEDSGWIYKNDKEILKTSGPSDSLLNKNFININGYFYKQKFRYQSPLSLFALRFLNFFGLYKPIKRIMREKMILESKRSNIKFFRKIKIENNKIDISDSFTPKIKNILLSHDTFHIYSTSTNLYEKKTENVKDFFIDKSVDKIKIIIAPYKVSLVY